MKVTFIENAEDYLTVSEMKEAKQIIKSMKGERLEDYVSIVTAHLQPLSSWKLLSSEAEICTNDRAWNDLSENSRNLDIWITLIVFNNYSTFYKLGMYLTDIWKMSPETEKEIFNRSAIRRYEYTPEQ